MKPIEFSFSHSFTNYFAAVEYNGTDFRQFDAVFISSNIDDDVLCVAEVHSMGMCECCDDVYLFVKNLEYMYFSAERNSYTFKRSDCDVYPFALKDLILYKSYDLIDCNNILYLLREIDFFSIYGV